MNCVYKKDFVIAMLAAGADPSIADRFGNTAAVRARSSGMKDIADLLDAAVKARASQ